MPASAAGRRASRRLHALIALDAVPFTALRTKHEAAVRAGDGALDEQQVALGVALDDLEVERGDLLRCRCWPAICMPLNTRAGVAQAPIEPGRAVLLVVAVAGALAVKLWRFIDAGEALALADRR